MGRFGSLVAMLALAACQFASETPPDRTADPVRYCAWLADYYSSYVGAVGPETVGDRRGAQGGLEARVAIAQCQQGNTAAGIAVLERKLAEAKVSLPAR